MKLEDLAVKHSYYCSDSNWTERKAGGIYETMTEYLNEMESSDVDLNLCFRWDVLKDYDDDGNHTGKYSAMVFIMQQRKGRFCPHYIRSITELETERFVLYIQKHAEMIKNIWKPIIK